MRLFRRDERDDERGPEAAAAAAIADTPSDDGRTGHAAGLPRIEVPVAELQFRDAMDRDAELLVRAAADDLAAAESGVAFIYRLLDRVVRRTGAVDGVVVLEETGAGRQAFRAGRRPVDGGWAAEVIRSAPVGVHLVPDELDPPVAASVANLCGLALRLDLARHDSIHDPLTGVLNRRSFDDQLAAAAAQTARYGWSFALVLVDLDHFKLVNDRLGHEAGDRVLRAVGNELRRNLRAGDLAARLGGDEFALVLPHGDHQVLPSLLARLDQAVKAAQPEVSVGISAGVAVAPADGTDPATLLRVADQRLYETKRSVPR